MIFFHEQCATTVHMRMKSHECIVVPTTRKSRSGKLEMQPSESMRPLAYFHEKKSNGATGNGSTRTADAKSKQTTANFD